MFKIFNNILAILNFSVFCYLFLPFVFSDSIILSIENGIVFLVVMTLNNLFFLFSSATFLNNFGDNDTFIEVAMIGVSAIILSVVLFILELPFDGIKDRYLLLIVITTAFNIFKVLGLFCSASNPFTEGI